MSDFVKFYRKSLPDSTTDVSVIVLKDLTVEDCASRCVQSGGGCDAFHVCRSGATKHRAPLCAMSQQSLESRVQSSRMSANQLIESPDCTAFMMTTESLKRTIESSVGDLDEFLTSMSGVSRRKMSRQKGSGLSFWSSIMIILMGTASGYVITMAIKRRREFS